MKLLKILVPSLLVALLWSCNKEVEKSPALPALEPLRLDETAGSWTPVILSNNYSVQVPLAAPAATTSDAYKAELTTIKNAQAGLTKQQRDVIAYWSVGGVIRWNQIMRELVARYNLPPAPREDGTYVFPDAENPFADPAFPFANPPYAARAYAYVSIAQYDALKAAWYYKYLYNRAAPYMVDASVQSLVPRTSLPAYPSEDAVLSGVTAEMLKILFPASVEQITKLAADQRNAALWSGKAAPSDISAGLALGKSVASVITAPGSRFRTDGMGNAVGNAALWKELQDSVGFGDFYKSAQIPWLSLESPPRPPMLPNFGKVLTWNISPAQLVAERPAPPPLTSSEKMKQELAEVKKYADNATREELRITHKWADGAGTYAPPGHWNHIAEESVVNARFSEVRAARAYALLNMALHNAGVGCWEAKYYYFNPRPSQLDPSIKTKTGLPNFPSYTSGHSTFSASASVVLGYLFPDRAQFFTSEAKEASMSRLYGAIHYRSDIEVGYSHGVLLAAYTVNFAQSDGAGN